MDKLIIGIAGPAGCGKDTAADMLTNNFSFDRYSFATPIKDAIKAIFPHIADARLYGNKKEDIIPDLGVSARHMLQTLGTDWGREMVHPDIWLKAAESHIEAHSNSYFVIPDVRFDNEAEFIRDNDGAMICITRKDSADVIVHSSEEGITRSMNDYVVQNNGTIEELHKKIRAIADTEVQRWILELSA